MLDVSFTGRTDETPIGAPSAMTVDKDTDPMSPLTWSVLGIAIACTAVVLRLYDLEIKPLHHDEGVNGLFMTRLLGPPYTFRYDPANYHGPTLFYFAKITAMAFGLTTFAVRLVPAFFSIATVLVLFSLRPWIGALGALSAAALVAVSPGAVYFGRYFIHESLLVCFTTTAAIAAWEYRRRRRGWLLLTCAAAAALMFATKETAIITAVVLVGAAVAASLMTRLLPPGEISERRHRADAVSNLGRLGPASTVTRWTNSRQLVLIGSCLAVFLAVNIAFYSSFFSHWDGVRDAARAFTLWSKTGTVTHLQPWWTHLQWFWEEESALFALGLIGLVAAAWSRRSRFALFAAAWAFGLISAYSLIPYKTPWLELSFIVPLAILAGWLANIVYTEGSAWRRRCAVVLVILATAVSAYHAIRLNFFQYDDERHPYVYVHTSRQIFDLLNKIDEIQQRAASRGRLPVAIVSPDHFPLTWYLRGYPVGLYGRIVDTNDAIVLGSREQEKMLATQLQGRYVSIGTYKLRPGVDIVAYARRDLMD
jgi:uncharacterized protein (TIGR03663 family)